MSRATRRGMAEKTFKVLCASAALVGVLTFLVLLVDVLWDGIPYLSPGFLSSFASRFPERAGVLASLAGSLWVLSLTVLISFPVSVGAAIYLEEYAPSTWVTRAIRTNIASLAGVPSIVYGIIGLALFVRMAGFGRTVLAGALTLSLMLMPMITVAAAEAIRAVPQGYRTAAYGLGASRWQVVRHQVLPAALPGIITGTILAISRVVGEAAPLIMVGFLTFVAFTPQNLGDPFTVLPLQIFGWILRGEEFWGPAAAGIIVLLAFILTMNALALAIRNRFRVQDQGGE